jgi:hypothetical protein
MKIGKLKTLLENLNEEDEIHIFTGVQAAQMGLEPARPADPKTGFDPRKRGKWWLVPVEG